MSEVRNLNICLDISHSQSLQTQDSMLARKDVHEVLTTIWGCSEKLKKSAIVSLGRSFPDIKGMQYRLTLFFLWTQMLKHSHYLAFHLAKDQVENFIGQEFLLSTKLANGTYDLMTLDSLTIQIMKLSLTLIKVIKVCILQSDSRMCLINLSNYTL